MGGTTLVTLGVMLGARGGGATLVILGTTSAEGRVTFVTLGATLGATGATQARVSTSEASAVRGRMPRVARWRSIVAMTAAVMVSIRGPIEGRESALAAESQGVCAGIARVRRWAMRGGNSGESRSSRSATWKMRCETCLDFVLFAVRRGGGGAESLSEVGRRVARLETPRPLEGSSRRLGCGRSIE